MTYLHAARARDMRVGRRGGSGYFARAFEEEGRGGARGGAQDGEKATRPSPAAHANPDVLRLDLLALVEREEALLDLQIEGGGLVVHQFQ